MKGFYPDESHARAICQDQVASGHAADIIAFAAPDGNQLHAVGVAHNIEPRVRAGIPHRHTSDWDYVRIVLTEFRQVVRKSREAPRWYKALEVEKVHEAGEAVQWGGEVGEVAAQLMTIPIVRHSLPNANHRTNLRVTRIYLAFCDLKWPYWNLEGRGIARFYREANHYIERSKYLLQLIRHRKMIETARQVGFTALYFGPGRCVPIEDSDLSLSRGDLVKKHKQASMSFINRVCSAEGRTAIRSPVPGGRREFTEWALA